MSFHHWSWAIPRPAVLTDHNLVPLLLPSYPVSITWYYHLALLSIPVLLHDAVILQVFSRRKIQYFWKGIKTNIVLCLHFKKTLFREGFGIIWSLKRMNFLSAWQAFGLITKHLQKDAVWCSTTHRNAQKCPAHLSEKAAGRKSTSEKMEIKWVRKNRVKGRKVQQLSMTVLKSKGKGSWDDILCTLLPEQEEIQDTTLWTAKSAPLYASSDILEAEKLGFKIPTHTCHFNGYFQLSKWISNISPPNKQRKKPSNALKTIVCGFK